MKKSLKKIQDQVIVLTGASSGIGLCTARLAARQGARLVLAARSEAALRQLTDEITGAGGQAIYVVADVSQPADVQRLSQAAQQHFGGFDTWINNAGVSIYGRLDQVPVADMRKLFETNFWGLVYGSLEAARHLKSKGGAILNVGSILSDVTAILQAIYSASKHAVKGFTDGLRMELEMEGAPVAVTLIQPASIDTPYTLHAKNYMDRQAKHGPPAYAPDTVARAILHCCATPERAVVVGGGGRAFIGIDRWTPGLFDRYMETVFVRQEQADQPAPALADNGLDHAAGTLQERGNYPGHTRETSFYTQAATAGSPAVRTALLAAAAAGVGAGLTAWLARSPKHDGADGKASSNGTAAATPVMAGVNA